MCEGICLPVIVLLGTLSVGLIVASSLVIPLERKVRRLQEELRGHETGSRATVLPESQ